MQSILVVDDEPSICWSLEQTFTEEGFDVTAVSSAEEGLDVVRQTVPDVVLMDIRLPGIDGLDALQQLKDRLPNVPVVIMTAFGNLDTAVQAVSRGAFEYVTKPFNLDDAIAVVHRALDSASHLAGNSIEQTANTDDGPRQLMVGQSAAMQAVFRRIALVAQQDVPVLITGESGTGKELVATAIHQYSARSVGPFVPICVPAMSEALVESELFGHVKGAFTGAEVSRSGLLESAAGGTAFFDEIGDILPATQVKLLRVLETRQVTPVGGNESRDASFRLVAATNRNLETMVDRGGFREDFFYRLNVFRIQLPPLRDRGDDVTLLAQHFLKTTSSQQGLTLSPAAIEEIRSRPWYGNVRELRNAIEHAAIMAPSGVILPEYLPTPADNRNTGVVHSKLEDAVRRWWQLQLEKSDGVADLSGLYDRFLNEAEPVMLEQALRVGTNRKEASRILGLHRQTLREKLRRYGLDTATE